MKFIDRRITQHADITRNARDADRTLGETDAAAFSDILQYARLGKWIVLDRRQLRPRFRRKWIVINRRERRHQRSTFRNLPGRFGSGTYQLPSGASFAPATLGAVVLPGAAPACAAAISSRIGLPVIGFFNPCVS